MAEPQLPLQSPISAPRPELGPESVEPGPVTGRELAGYALWGGIGLLILVFECLAAFGESTPWPTISSTVGSLERHHPWVAVVILAGMVTLTARIVFYPWPNRQAEH
jgi:hypothetical protein